MLVWGVRVTPICRTQLFSTTSVLTRFTKTASITAHLIRLAATVRQIELEALTVAKSLLPMDVAVSREGEKQHGPNINPRRHPLFYGRLLLRHEGGAWLTPF